MSASPTQRSLQECKRRGWPAYVTEKRIPKVHILKDAFGFGDILAIDDQPGSVLIQCSSSDHTADRTAKILSIPTAKLWLERGNRILVWGWAKQGPAGKRKLWRLKERAISVSDFEPA